MGKAERRLFLKACRQKVFDEAGAEKSEMIMRRVLAFCANRRCKHVMCYVSAQSEVETHALICSLLSMGILVSVPKCVSKTQMEAVCLSDFDDLKPGYFGILEPEVVPEGATDVPIDLCLVPGLGFSKTGGRIGYGAGFYDRFLAGFSGLKVGLAFEEQVLDHLHQDAFDQGMHCIITDKRVVVCDSEESA